MRIVVLVALLAAPAHGDSGMCTGARTLADFQVAEGSWLAAEAGCGRFVLSTDAPDGGFGWGSATLEGDLPPAFEVTLFWQRLSPDSVRSLEVHVAGGALLLRDRAYGFYETDPQFAKRGWIDVAGLDTRREHHVRLVQRGRRLQAWIDGRPLGEHTLAARPERQRLRLALKGYRGLRGRMRFRDLFVTPLQ